MGMKLFGFDSMAPTGFLYAALIVNFVFCCQLLQPLVAAGLIIFFIIGLTSPFDQLLACISDSVADLFYLNN